MNPEQNLDQEAVQLARAIKRVENPKFDSNAKGASGEFGYYQWMPETWASTTKKYNLDAADLSEENQNKAAYMTIKELKDQGKQPDQIAAFWNSGKTEGWENMRGVNKYNVKYDVPGYVGKVRQAYDAIGAGQSTEGIVSPSTVGHQQIVDPRSTTEKVAKGLIDLNIGAVKGAGRTITGALEQGEAVANQTAGRVVSAITGRGFKPLPEEELGGNIARNESVKQTLTPTNTMQKIGGYAEKVGEIALPGGITGTMALKARTAARVFDDALQIVAPKEGVIAMRQAIRSGKASVDAGLDRMAKSIEDLVSKKVVSPKNSSLDNAEAVRVKLVNEAETLEKNLRSQEVQPIVSPQEVGTIVQKANAAIGENPTMVGDASEIAGRIFTKFSSFLPQKGDITAADILSARKKLDAWVKSQKPKALDPNHENAFSVAMRAIRTEANKLVAEKAPDVGVQESLKLQSTLYDVIEALAKKAEAAKPSLLKRVGKAAIIEGLRATGVGGYLKMFD